MKLQELEGKTKEQVMDMLAELLSSKFRFPGTRLIQVFEKDGDIKATLSVKYKEPILSNAFAWYLLISFVNSWFSFGVNGCTLDCIPG